MFVVCTFETLLEISNSEMKKSKEKNEYTNEKHTALKCQVICCLIVGDMLKRAQLSLFDQLLTRKKYN